MNITWNEKSNGNADSVSGPESGILVSINAFELCMSLEERATKHYYWCFSLQSLKSDNLSFPKNKKTKQNNEIDCNEMQTSAMKKEQGAVLSACLGD